MRRLPFSRLLFLALAAAALVRPLAAVESRVMRDDDFATLAQGELQSVALTSDGYLLPTYDRRPVGDTGAEIVWDAVATPDGVLCATGHQGRLVLLDDDGSTRAVATLSDPELTALLRLSDGAVIAAGAPSGRLYRVGADDVVTTWTRLDASFVWKLAQGPDGSVWVALGVGDKLAKVPPRS